MFRIIVAVLLVLAAHYNLTAFAPTTAGQAWFGWPFAADSKPWIAAVGGLPQQSGSVLTPALAGIAGLCFLAAAFSLIGWLVPSEWWRPLVSVGACASAALYLLYFGPWAIVPLLLDALLLWGLFAQNWTVEALR